MDIRSKIQQEALEAWFNSNQKSMLNCAPRVGKCKIAIDIIKKGNFNNILIALPRNDIQESWEADFIKWGFKPNVEYTTFLSAKKLKDFKGDLLIIDEPQEASVNQLKELSKIVDNNKTLLLSGTITWKTEKELSTYLKTDICYKYSIEEAVEAGILADYSITIHKIDLDSKVKSIETKKGFVTEKERFRALSWVRNNLIKEQKPFMFLDLKLINLIQNSLSKSNYTKKLLKDWGLERILVFCGLTEVADKLEIPVYHSKSKEKDIFTDFCNGKGKHLATVKLMQSGITILPISKGIINYTSGSPEDTAQKLCRFLGIEYLTPDKKADIHIICSTEEFEIKRLETGLKFFDNSKIKWIKIN